MKQPDQQKQGTSVGLGRKSVARTEPGEVLSTISDESDLSLYEIAKRLGISEKAARALLEASKKARE
jgi:plasmid maintenance system antidote protein VapI